MSLASPAEVLDALQRAADRNQNLLQNNRLEVWVGDTLGCPVLKIDKPSWHNRGKVEVPGQIFFSIWQDQTGQIDYNIHAFKLRNLKPYKLESRKFAEAFRAKLNQNDWPHVLTGYGPLTLMQGWIELSDEQLDSLIRRFIDIHHLIDDLLT